MTALLRASITCDKASIKRAAASSAQGTGLVGTPGQQQPLLRLCLPESPTHLQGERLETCCGRAAA